MNRLTLHAAIVAGLAVALFAASPVLAGKGKPASGNGPVTGVITVPDTQYAGTTTATVNPGGADTYVFVQCYAPDFGGTYVYAAYFPVDSSNHATVGPLWSTLWPQGNASCTAEEGYFTRNGFGRWESLAATTFHVTG
jgi:hypothetical protein